MSNPETPAKTGKRMTKFDAFALMIIGIVAIWIVTLQIGAMLQLAEQRYQAKRTINGLPALQWTNVEPNGLYSEQEPDGAYRYLCTSDERKCLSVKDVMAYINANGQKRPRDAREGHESKEDALEEP